MFKHTVFAVARLQRSTHCLFAECAYDSKMAQFAKHALTKSGPVVWPRRRSRRSTTQPKGGSFKSGNDATLLWIDDFAPALSLYKATMENLGFKVLTASSGEAGVKRASME